MAQWLKKNSPLFLYLLLLVILFWLGNRVHGFFNKPLIAVGDESRKIFLLPGSSARGLADNLLRENLLKDPILFMLFVHLSGVEHNLKAGEYLVETGITLPQLIRKMVKGEAVRHSFTIIEGWNFAQIVKALGEHPYLRHSINGLTSEEIMKRIGHGGEYPEGKFAPDTYLFSGELEDIVILANAYNLMQRRLGEFWPTRAANLPYVCPYEALIVASLIEKETSVFEERFMVSGVILNRLNKNMLLQIDPSVIYGLGAKFSGKLRKKDLAHRGKYNTYLRKGLPPTPICMPGVDSMRAALHPSITPYLYYVSKGDGTHQFSTSLGEQSRAIRKYLLHRNS